MARLFRCPLQNFMLDWPSGSERKGMYLLPELVAEYDKKRMTVRTVLQLQIFVTDEAPATPGKAPDDGGVKASIYAGNWRLVKDRETA